MRRVRGTLEFVAAADTPTITVETPFWCCVVFFFLLLGSVLIVQSILISRFCPLVYGVSANRAIHQLKQWNSPKTRSFFERIVAAVKRKDNPLMQLRPRHEADPSQSAANQTGLSIGYTASHSGRSWEVEINIDQWPQIVLPLNLLQGTDVMR